MDDHTWCQQFIRVGKMVQLPNSSKLAGRVRPGAKFSSSSAQNLSIGTITCIIKAQLKILTQGKVKPVEELFAVTCAHCILPINPNDEMFKEINLSKSFHQQVTINHTTDDNTNMWTKEKKTCSSLKQNNQPEHTHQLIEQNNQPMEPPSEHRCQIVDTVEQLNNQPIEPPDTTTTLCHYYPKDSFDPTVLFQGNSTHWRPGGLLDSYIYQHPPNTLEEKVVAELQMIYFCSRFGVFTSHRLCLNGNWCDARNSFCRDKVVYFNVDFGILTDNGSGSFQDDDQESQLCTQTPYVQKKSLDSCTSSYLDIFSKRDLAGGERTFIRPKKLLLNAVKTKDLILRPMKFESTRDFRLTMSCYKNIMSMYMEELSKLSTNKQLSDYNKSYQQHLTMIYQKFINLPKELESEQLKEKITELHKSAMFEVNHKQEFVQISSRLTDLERMLSSHDHDQKVKETTWKIKQKFEIENTIGSTPTQTSEAKAEAQQIAEIEQLNERKFQPKLQRIATKGLGFNDTHTCTNEASDNQEQIEEIDLQQMVDIWRDSKSKEVPLELQIVKNREFIRRNLLAKDFYFELNFKEKDTEKIIKIPVIIFNSHDETFIEDGDSGSPLFLFRNDQNTSYFLGNVCSEAAATRWDIGIQTVAPQILQCLLDKAKNKYCKTGSNENLEKEIRSLRLTLDKEVESLPNIDSELDTNGNQYDSFPWNFHAATSKPGSFKTKVTAILKISPMLEI